MPFKKNLEIRKGEWIIFVLHGKLFFLIYQKEIIIKHHTPISISDSSFVHKESIQLNHTPPLLLC